MSAAAWSLMAASVSSAAEPVRAAAEPSRPRRAKYVFQKRLAAFVGVRRRLRDRAEPTSHGCAWIKSSTSLKRAEKAFLDLARPLVRHVLDIGEYIRYDKLLELLAVLRHLVEVEALVGGITVELFPVIFVVLQGV